MYEVGRAGAFVSGQQRRRQTTAAIHAATAALLSVTAAGSFVAMALASAPPLRAVAGAAGLVMVVGIWRAATRSASALRQAGQAAVGARSERTVRAAVRRTGAIAAAYGLVLGRGRGGDCDAVVFTGGLGAAAIEVKTGHGEVTVDGGVMRVGTRVLHKSPTGQAASQARKLSSRLGHKAVLAVVCVPAMTNRRFITPSGVWVCSTADLGAVLDGAPVVFGSAAEARETMKRLWRQADAPGGAGRPERRSGGRMPDDR